MHVLQSQDRAQTTASILDSNAARIFDGKRAATTNQRSKAAAAALRYKNLRAEQSAKE